MRALINLEHMSALINLEHMRALIKLETLINLNPKAKPKQACGSAN
jgi:hypothetical protein